MRIKYGFLFEVGGVNIIFLKWRIIINICIIYIVGVQRPVLLLGDHCNVEEGFHGGCYCISESFWNM